MTTKAEFARRIIVEGKWPDHVNNYVALIVFVEGVRSHWSQHAFDVVPS